MPEECTALETHWFNRGYRERTAQESARAKALESVAEAAREYVGPKPMTVEIARALRDAIATLDKTKGDKDG